MRSVLLRRQNIIACSCAVALSVVVLSAASARADEAVQTGTVHYSPAADEETVAERFRLPEHVFDFRQAPLETSSEAIEIFELTFPSPVETPVPENNTVHCEYFRPVASKRD